MFPSCLCHARVGGLFPPAKTWEVTPVRSDGSLTGFDTAFSFRMDALALQHGGLLSIVWPNVY
jgi:hypothetical protein